MQDLRRIQSGLHGIVFGGGAASSAERRLRPPPQQNLKCPRCDSVNTKFCYFNNYNISQPRHFCKSCRRYWTKGGVLRNVPVGGSCRKAKRSSSSRAHKADKPTAAADSGEVARPEVAFGGGEESRRFPFQVPAAMPAAEQVGFVEAPVAGPAAPPEWQGSWLYEEQGGLWSHGQWGEMDPFLF